MEVHANAPLSPIGRRRVVDRVVGQRWSVAAAAEAAGVTERTVYRWLARWRAEGPAGLVDRRSVPKRIPHKTPPERVAAICQLRQGRLTAAEIAEALSMPLSTVSAVLLREGLGKRSRLQPPEPVNRYERSAAGELVHIDIKKLGNIPAGGGHRMLGRVSGRRHNQTDRSSGQLRSCHKPLIGYGFIHTAVDDHSRLAYAEIHDDETAATATTFLHRAHAWFAARGIRVERVLTDNGSCYRAHRWRQTCRQLGITPKRTRPYRPQTNGKAERFNRTLLDEWAYRRLYTTESARRAAFAPWLHWYNRRVQSRPGGGGLQPSAPRSSAGSLAVQLSLSS
jgi:transposase InsO family protein